MKNNVFFWPEKISVEYQQYFFFGLGFIVLCHILRLILGSCMKAVSLMVLASEL